MDGALHVAWGVGGALEGEGDDLVSTGGVEVAVGVVDEGAQEIHAAVGSHGRGRGGRAEHDPV